MRNIILSCVVLSYLALSGCAVGSNDNVILYNVSGKTAKTIVNDLRDYGINTTIPDVEDALKQYKETGRQEICNFSGPATVYKKVCATFTGTVDAEALRY